MPEIQAVTVKKLPRCGNCSAPLDVSSVVYSQIKDVIEITCQKCHYVAFVIEFYEDD